MRIYLPADLQLIINDLAERFQMEPEEAVEFALRDWMIGQGLLDPEHELDEDTPTEGTA